MKKLFYTLALLTVIALAASAKTRSPKSTVAEQMALFSSVMKELQTNYVDSIDLEESVKMAIDAMLYKLDPYTEYMPRKEQEDFSARNSGEYGGIGSYVSYRDSNVYISGPHEGSPAARAGLRWGDVLLRVDTTDVTGLTTEKVTELLKGPRGTAVSVKVRRPYVADSILTFNIIRDKIQIPAVTYAGVIDSTDIGYIFLNQFSEKAADEVYEALDTLISRQHIKSLVLDLRDNGGGYLEAAVKILGYFLPKGTEVLRTRGKGVLEEKIYKTSGKPLAPDMPLVVLTNGSTASASEITAGALQDLDRAVIVGSRSYGKGLVQTTRPLPQSGLLKVTVAKYYIPSGRLIQAIDYSQRNPDGSVGRIPDSLTTAYTTRAGRTVRDGGGITPDIEVTYPDVSRVTYNVVSDMWAFDFANKYFNEHPDLAGGDFIITDTVYSQFKKFIDPDRFNYDKVWVNILDRLREAARIEGLMTDSLSSVLTTAESLMHRSLDADLDANRAAIAPYLEREIAERYAYRAGDVRSLLRHDPAVDSVRSLLADPSRYKALLAPVKKK